MALRLDGAFTAMVTPFRGGAVDLATVASLTEWQVTEGIGGLVPCGTTGESPTVTAAEAKEIIATVVRVVNKRVPVIAGTGTNATAETIVRTRAAQELGADAAMVVMPYYNKPSQAGLVAHVRADPPRPRGEAPQREARAGERRYQQRRRRNLRPFGRVAQRPVGVPRQHPEGHRHRHHHLVRRQRHEAA